ncbi:MAG: RES domain-containing protein [Gemmatimonadales bacterium]|nr:MAG: RES domain-containing protein [Gemmatimonadales bacterium]
MVRVYHRDYRPESFNPGVRTEPLGRFHFFDDERGRRVPVLYTAEGEDAAISETVFRDLPVGSREPAVVPESLLAFYGLVRLRARRDLALVELHGHGLRRLGLRPGSLTGTGPEGYPRTVEWARALHGALPEADGLVWMSRQFNSERAIMLFGDRAEEVDLERLGPGVPLRTGPGRVILDRAANASGVLIA